MHASLEAAPPQESARLRPLSGNEAIARGAWEAGVTVAAAYPGTPSTEIMETLARYPAEHRTPSGRPTKRSRSTWPSAPPSRAPRAGRDEARGAERGGRRLMSQTYIGVNGGLVLVVCDDPGIHSSQNEQDTRLYCRLASVPCWSRPTPRRRWSSRASPSRSRERFDTPVIVRSTTRLSHTRSPVQLGAREDADRRLRRERRQERDDPHQRPGAPPDAARARGESAGTIFDDATINRWETRRHRVRRDHRRHLLLLRAGRSRPTRACSSSARPIRCPTRLLRRILRLVDRVFVVEELEPVIETRNARAIGIEVAGKAFFPRDGRVVARTGARRLREGGRARAARAARPLGAEPTGAPAGAVRRLPPHLELHGGARAGARVAGDIGCYTLAALDPLRGHRHLRLHGLSHRQRHRHGQGRRDRSRCIATIGDSTFLHARHPAADRRGLQQREHHGDAARQPHHRDDRRPGSSGHRQDAARRGRPRGSTTKRWSRAIGVKWVRKVDSYDVADMYQTLREAIAHQGVSVVISDRPCVLDPMKIKGPPLAIVQRAVQRLPDVHEPRLPGHDLDGRDVRRPSQGQDRPGTCIGCTLCAQVCTVGLHQAPRRRVNERACDGRERHGHHRRPDVVGRHGAPTNVLIVGVGGQGVIMVSKVLARLRQSQGLRGQAERSARHGQARRRVFSHVRFGSRCGRRRSPRARPTSWSRWSGPRACAGCPTSSRAPASSCATPSGSCRRSPACNRRPGAPLRYSRETPAEVTRAGRRGLRARRHRASRRNSATSARPTRCCSAPCRPRSTFAVERLGGGARRVRADQDHRGEPRGLSPRPRLDREARGTKGRRRFARTRDGTAPRRRLRRAGARVRGRSLAPYDVRLEITPQWCKGCDICVKLCPRALPAR